MFSRTFCLVFFLGGGRLLLQQPVWATATFDAAAFASATSAASADLLVPSGKWCSINVATFIE